MTTMQRDPLVDDYLRRLEAAAADLPRERRAELVSEIEEHVDAALREAGTTDEVALRNVLERLGSPEEIAAAAGPPPAPRPERGRLESIALVVLAVSFLVPLFGYLVGASLVVASRAWEGREKLIALVIPPLAVLAGACVLLLVATGVAGSALDDSGLGPVELLVVAVIVFSGLIASAYLSSRLPPSDGGP